MPTIQNIIFDYGNVIFMIDFARTQYAFEKLGISKADQIFAHTNQISFFDEFDKGMISKDEFRDHIRKIACNPKLSNQEIDNAWNALLIGIPNPNYHEALLQAKNKYRTFLLSNNNVIHYQYIMDYLATDFQLNGNETLFEKDYYSHLMGMRKPDRDIFDFIVETHFLEPKKTLFIDDSPQHIATAQKLGFQTHLMTPKDQLPKLLRKKGLI